MVRQLPLERTVGCKGEVHSSGDKPQGSQGEEGALQEAKRRSCHLRDCAIWIR